jgi:hypothetical protein
VGGKGKIRGPLAEKVSRSPLLPRICGPETQFEMVPTWKHPWALTGGSGELSPNSEPEPWAGLASPGL